MKVKNPVLKGFFPDPSFLRVGEDYYIATLTLGFEKFSSVATSMERTAERRLLRISIVSR